MERCFKIKPFALALPYAHQCFFFKSQKMRQALMLTDSLGK